jgi:4-hydroxybenzoate polyprenyltransferase
MAVRFGHRERKIRKEIMMKRACIAGIGFLIVMILAYLFSSEALLVAIICILIFIIYSVKETFNIKK